MIRSGLAVVAIAVGITAVVAQSDPIATRKQLMKDMGAVTKTGATMAKGEAPYDQTKAQQMLATYIDVSTKAPALFPDNSKTGGETAALPAVWENMGDFKGKFDKLAAEAKAAQTSVKDLDTFKSAFGGLTKNCGGCHETYRAKKS
jgi:cytochrome c556